MGIDNDITQIDMLPYSIYFWDRQAWVNSVDPDQKLMNLASDQGLHCLPLIQQFLDMLTGSQMDL